MIQELSGAAGGCQLFDSGHVSVGGVPAIVAGVQATVAWLPPTEGGPPCGCWGMP